MKRRGGKTSQRLAALEEEVDRQGTEFTRRIDHIEDRVSSVERALEAQLGEFGDYKNRSQAELAQAQVRLQQIIEVLEALVNTAENQEDTLQARQLLRRARNNLTRARKAAAA